jgi:hypothetical protein
MAPTHQGEKRQTYDRRRDTPYIVISSEQLAALADSAAEKAINRIYTEIGKRVTRKAILVIGGSMVAISAYVTDAVKIDMSKFLMTVQPVAAKK